MFGSGIPSACAHHWEVANVETDEELQALDNENRRLKEQVSGWEEQYRSLVARVHNAARGSAADTVRLAFPPGHYYSEIPALSELLVHADRIWPSLPPKSIPGIDLNEDHQLALLAEVAKYYREQPFTDQPQEGFRYYFQNELYTYADSLYLYGILRHLRPRRVFEVGSGFSSAVMLDTNERFLDGQVQCTFVDPEPERLYSLLSGEDRRTVEIIPGQIQDIPLRRFDVLEANDILFIDSSHVTKTGSDVNHLIFEVLPRLASGVYVHIHDIFYPFEYLREWLEDGRHWSEGYLVRAFLMFNHDFEIDLFNNYLYQFHADRLAQLMPLVLKHPGLSLWLHRK
jgi:hypothetical protein